MQRNCMVALMTDLSKLSFEQLQRRLEKLADEWNQVEAEIERRVREDKKMLAHEIKQKIVDSGYDLEDILRLLRKRGPGRNA